MLQPESKSSIIEKNKKSITALLRKLSISKVVLGYTGQGDSGNGVDLEEVVLLNNSSEGFSALSSDRTSVKLYNLYAGEAFQHKGLLSALISFVEELVDDTHSGWENDSGGGGTFTIEYNEGTGGYSFKLDHYYNIITEEYTFTEI